VTEGTRISEKFILAASDPTISGRSQSDVHWSRKAMVDAYLKSGASLKVIDKP
jgi:hypothetical protein